MDILNLAIKTHRPPPWHTKVDSIQEWTGTDFDIISVEAVAILALADYTTGSPSGVAVGFFPAQHKQQRGGDKMISKITVFKARQPVTDDDYPTLIFWVRDAPNLYGEVGGARLADVSNVGSIGVVEDWRRRR
ncbi:uncharacterized protein J4E87_006757 [Alternaria ethzedia]|uniref:uncharacterized protein n=1 Tax=Alternaria ethzedia TaxID=181014 RepID=UPI0020C2338E|nr:uncharacterized protein J4E87_006757 [Alternaria ethzedia]KAI4621129.1 hypothetical protein J4E87_006757 [Alternaria ethzedia]